MTTAEGQYKQYTQYEGEDLDELKGLLTDGPVLVKKSFVDSEMELQLQPWTVSVYYEIVPVEIMQEGNTKVVVTSTIKCQIVKPPVIQEVEDVV